MLFNSQLDYMNLPFCVTILVFALCFTLLGVGCSEKEPTNLENETEPRVESDLAITRAEPSANANYTSIQWTDLLPDEDLEALKNPPEYLAEIEDGSESDQLTSQLKAESTVGSNNTGSGSTAEDRYQQALTSKKIRLEFNGRHVRIPGFIVPLEFDDHQTITTFFLVPFFGACIHMPPPPPNQIVYAEYEPGIRLEALYDPFWVSGTLSTALVENDMATAAYSINVSTIEPYIETGSQQWNDAETP